MSGQGEDNTALQSEISVLEKMLTIERKASDDLRTKNIELLNKLDTARVKNISIERQRQVTISKYEIDLVETKKHLKTALTNTANGLQLNKQLKTNVATLATEVVRLRNRIKLLEKIVIDQN